MKGSILLCMAAYIVSLTLAGQTIQVGPYRFHPQNMELDQYRKSPASSGASYRIIQAEQSVLTDLKAKGYTILWYYPTNGYLISVPDQYKSKKTCEIEPEVKLELPYYNHFKKSQELMLGYTKDKKTSKYHLLIDANYSDKKIYEEIGARTNKILDLSVQRKVKKITAETTFGQIEELINIPEVLWIERAVEYQIFNDVATNQILKIAPVNRYYGQYGGTQTVCVCDTGIDKGTTNPTQHHADFTGPDSQSRIIKIYDMFGDGANDVNSGHGTHVSGSVLGNGRFSGSDASIHDYVSTSYAGSAPEAKLVFQATEDNTNKTLAGLPNDLHDLFGPPYGDGARIHTNSWGGVDPSAPGGGYGYYDSSCSDLDDYVFSNPEMNILFSAGNYGKDANADGVVDLNSMARPATSKNCVTIGATENYRSPTQNQILWGTSWPTDFSAEPVKSDLADNNANGMAAFSSRGPCQDQRYKPDLVAPGSNIISTRSQEISSWGWGNESNSPSGYIYMGGTSMATPLAAGCTAIMREYLQTKQAISNPSAALIRSAMVNSATDITPGQYDAQHQEIPAAPNHVEGFGRINMESALGRDDGIQWRYIDAGGVTTGTTKEYTVTSTQANKPLCATLCWNDAPSAAGTGGLINNLDMKIIGPDSQEYHPKNPLQRVVSNQQVLAYHDSGAENVISGNLGEGTGVIFTPGVSSYSIEKIYFGLMFYFQATFAAAIYDSDPSTGNISSQLYYKEVTYTPQSIGETGTFSITLDPVIPRTSDRNFFVVLYFDGTGYMDMLVDQSSDAGRNFWVYADSSTAITNTGNWLMSTQIATQSSETPYPANKDNVNNTEKIIIDNAAAGTYRIIVEAQNIASTSAQPFAVTASYGGQGSSSTDISTPMWTLFQ